MVSEDFSFPKIITNPLPQFTLSPSLWRVSSLVYPESNTGDEEEDQNGTVEPELAAAGCVLPRKSFSHLEYYDEEMEKMDMLWEDFNEDLKGVSSLRSSRTLDQSSKSMELHIAQAPKLKKMSETGSSGMMIYRHKRRQSYSMWGVMKSLKKMFSLPNIA